MRTWPLALALAVLTAGSYVNALPRALVHDDNTALLQNPHFGGVETIPRIFRESVWEGIAGNRRLYRPIAMASLSVDRSLFGGDPRGYHLTSASLHVGATLLLFGFLASLGAGALPAFLAALVFGVHPIHTEAVDVAFNRSEILAALGVVGALWWLWSFAERRPALAWTGASILYLLALLSRESAVTLPVLAVLCLWLLRPVADTRSRLRLVAPVVVLLVPLAVYLAMRQAALGEAAGGIVRSLGAEGIGGSHSPLGRLALVSATVRDYWRMMVWPWPLRASYEDYVVRGVLVSVALHATLVAVAVALRKRFPAVTVGIAFFYVALIPSTRLFADPAVLAERFVYLPSVGPAILLAFALAAWVARQGTRLPSVACAVVIAAFGLTTLQRNTAWRSRDSLWEAEARTSRDDWRVLLNLSQVRLGQRRFEETIALCDRGIAVAPTRTAFQTNRAVALASLGRMADAEEAFAKAAEQSHESGAYANLARLYATTGRKDQAERAYAQAQEHETDPAAREVLDGERLLLCRGDAAGARAAFTRALAISPNLQAAKHGLMLVGG